MIRQLPDRQAAGRWDNVDGPHTWRALDHVEADHLEGPRALAWLVLQSQRPGYGFSDPASFTREVVRHG